jgi:hypothetical protein
MCLMFLIFKPLGSCPGASSISGRLGDYLPSPLFFFFLYSFVCKYNMFFFIKSMWLINFVCTLFYFGSILCCSYLVFY